jgi:hypothetical protein
MVLKRGSDSLDFLGQMKGNGEHDTVRMNLVKLRAEDEELTENEEVASEGSLIALTCKQRALPSTSRNLCLRLTLIYSRTRISP